MPTTPGAWRWFRDQAPVPVQGRSRPRSSIPPGRRRLRSRGSGLPVRPHRRGVLRRRAQDLAHGPGRRARSLSCARTSPSAPSMSAMPGPWAPTPSCSSCRAHRRRARSFLALAERLSLTALVEVHDELELKRALAAGAGIIGVNQRDLRTFEVDRDGPWGWPIDPSRRGGGRRVGDPRRRRRAALAGAGYRAVLVGEALVRSGDRRAAVGRTARVRSVSTDRSRPSTGRRGGSATCS